MSLSVSMPGSGSGSSYFAQRMSPQSPLPLQQQQRRLSRTASVGAAAKQLKPFATEDIKVLLLENINATGRELLERQGYQVEFLKTSLPEEQLIEKIRYVVFGRGGDFYVRFIYICGFFLYFVLFFFIKKRKKKH